MSAQDLLGPPLTEVAPDDAEGLRLLFQEQRARIAFVQQNAAWGWFGGVPLGFGPPQAIVRGTMLSLAMVGAMAVTLVVAGCTRGPVLWVAAGLVPVLWVLRYLLCGRHERATLRLYRRARLVPAVVVARTESPGEPSVWQATAIVCTRDPDPKSFAALLAAADRLRAHVDGSTAVQALAPVVAAIQAAGPDAFDGRRVPLPRELGDELELTRFLLPPVDGGEQRHESRLVFVLVAPGDRRPGHTRAVTNSLWGEAGQALCAAFPWEVQP